MADLTELRRSPLHNHTAQLQAASTQALSIAEVPFTTQIGLRAEPGTPGYEALANALGGLPQKVGEVTGQADQTAVLWLAPDEFLAIAPETVATPQALNQELTTALAEHPGQVVELSANRTIIELTGDDAPAVLRKSCPLDVDPKVFQINTAYVTEVAQTPVLLWRTTEQTWRIIPRSSFATHVANWLLDATLEFR